MKCKEENSVLPVDVERKEDRVLEKPNCCLLLGEKERKRDLIYVIYLYMYV